MPLLQGIDIGSPYKAVTVSVAHTGTQKAADCYSNYTQPAGPQRCGRTEVCFHFHGRSDAAFESKEYKEASVMTGNTSPRGRIWTFITGKNKKKLVLRDCPAEFLPFSPGEGRKGAQH